MQWILLLFIYCFIGAYNCEENNNSIGVKKGDYDEVWIDEVQTILSGYLKFEDVEDNFAESNNFVVLQSKNYPSRSIGVKNGDDNAVWIDEAPKFPSGHFKFKEVKGLAFKNTELRRRPRTEKIVSFEFGNFYIRHSNFKLYLDKLPENDNVLFNQDASFVVREQEGKYKGYIQLESFNFPGRFVHHDGFRVTIENKKDDDAFKEFTSFLRISSKEEKSINIQTSLSRCYVGLDSSNIPRIPRIVSRNSATLFRMVRGSSDRNRKEYHEEEGSDGDIDRVSFAIDRTESNTQYLQHGTDRNIEKLFVAEVPFEDRAGVYFNMIKDKLNPEYKAFQSLDDRSRFIHSDGDKLTLQLIRNIQDTTAEKNRAIYFTFTHGRFAERKAYGTLTTLDFYYIGIFGNHQPRLFNVPTALRIVQGLAGRGTVSFKIKISTFLVSQMNAEKYCKLFRVSFAENNGELGFKSSASWYIEGIKDNHEYVFLRSYDCNEYYIHRSCDGLTVKKKSTSTEEGGFYFKINPNTQQVNEH